MLGRSARPDPLRRVRKALRRDYHLRKVSRKLDIADRAQLARAGRADGAQSRSGNRLAEPSRARSAIDRRSRLPCRRRLLAGQRDLRCTGRAQTRQGPAPNETKEVLRC